MKNIYSNTESIKIYISVIKCSLIKKFYIKGRQSNTFIFSCSDYIVELRKWPIYYKRSFIKVNVFAREPQP